MYCRLHTAKAPLRQNKAAERTSGNRPRKRLRFFALSLACIAMIGPTRAQASGTNSVATVVSAANEAYYGEWVQVGYKDKLEDELTAVGGVTSYALVADGTVTLGAYGPYTTDVPVHDGPYGTYYAYRDSGGIDGRSYLDTPAGLKDYMLDSDGRLLAISYDGEGRYSPGIEVFEKNVSGRIETFLNSKGKSLYDGVLEKDDYLFSTVDYGQAVNFPFVDIFHWNFVGFAENPYFSGAYYPESMLSFYDGDPAGWTSYFKLGRDGGVYSSATFGTAKINAPVKYSSEYHCSYYQVSSKSGEKALSLNIFIGSDRRAYLCVADAGGERLCTTHFFVYEMSAPDLILRTANLSASAEDFVGIWKTGRRIYWKTGQSMAYSPGDFDFWVIRADGTLDCVQHIEVYGKDDLNTYTYSYIDRDGYLEVEDMYGNGVYRVLFILNNDGQLVNLEYPINNGRSLTYTLFDRYSGSLERGVDEFFAETE